MNLTGRPIYQKQGKAKKPRKPMRKVSAKRAAYKRSDAGKLASLYMGLVKSLPCAVCRAPAPSEGHHCRDLPDQVDAHIYVRQAAGGRKSSDFDAVPLCEPCHDMFHLQRAEFHEKAGLDYRLIPTVRATVCRLVAPDTWAEMERKWNG